MTHTQLISNKPVKLDKINRKELINYFDNSWLLTEYLFGSIKKNSFFYLNPEPRRHPLIFYYGHVAVFYINKLRAAGLFVGVLDPMLESLFAVGVDPSTKYDLKKFAWPEYSKVVNFRSEIYQIVKRILESIDLPEKIDWDSPYWSILMAIEHERIHFETTSVLIRQSSHEMVSRPLNWTYVIDSDYVPESRFVSISGADVTLGRPINSNMYGWDNEYGKKVISVSTFDVGANLITNHDYLKFIESGGYSMKEYWTSEGWNWVKEQGIKFPKFWVRDHNSFKLRAMFDVIDMPWNWPVEVIAHEAEAFCKWNGDGFRLLTEAEWKRITDVYYGCLVEDFPNAKNANINFHFGSPVPVGYLGGNAPFDIIGNVWEILADDFSPLPNFRTHPYYKDFSLPFFGKDHGMMAGGSWASTGNSASRFYRLWFRRDFVQHAGFRLVREL